MLKNLLNLLTGTPKRTQKPWWAQNLESTRLRVTLNVNVWKD